MKRIVTAREQHEMLSPWLIEAGPKAPALDNDWMVQNILDHYNHSTDEHKAAGAQWYPSAREFIKNIADKTNRDPNRAAAIMAAMSPQEEWERNIQNGTNFMLNYDPANPGAWHQNPNKPTQGTGTPGLGDNINRAIAVHHAHPDQIYQALGNGPKVQNFYRNLSGDDDSVTVDGHMAKAIMGEGGQLADYGNAMKALSPKDSYNQMSDAVKKAAAETGISPSQMQATVWLKYQSDMENQTKQTYEQVHPGQAYEDRANEKLLGPAKYNTPDFTKGKELSQHPPGLDPEVGPMRPEQRVLAEPTYRASPGYNKPYSQFEEDQAPAPPEYNNLMVDKNTTPTGKPKTKGLWGPYDEKKQKWSARENPMRIRTAKEYVDMLSPWAIEAGWHDTNYDPRVDGYPEEDHNRPSLSDLHDEDPPYDEGYDGPEPDPNQLSAPGFQEEQVDDWPDPDHGREDHHYDDYDPNSSENNLDHFSHRIADVRPTIHTKGKGSLSGPDLDSIIKHHYQSNAEFSHADDSGLGYHAVVAPNPQKNGYDVLDEILGVDGVS